MTAITPNQTLKAGRFLVIESSFTKADVALYENGEVSLIEGFCEQKHSDYLLPHIQKLLQNKGYLNGVKKLDAIALSAGPGSFTALRVSVAIAKALALSFKLPLIGIDSLMSIAMSSVEKIELESEKITDSTKSTILVLMDARVKELYSADFELELGQRGQGTKPFQTKLTRKNPNQLIPVSDFDDFFTDYYESLSNECDESMPETNRAKLYLVGNFHLVYESCSRLIKEKMNHQTQQSQLELKLLECNQAKISAMIDLALGTMKEAYQNANDFQINYVRNQVADVSQKKTREA